MYPWHKRECDDDTLKPHHAAWLDAHPNRLNFIRPSPGAKKKRQKNRRVEKARALGNARVAAAMAQQGIT